MYSDVSLFKDYIVSSKVFELHITSSSIRNEYDLKFMDSNFANEFLPEFTKLATAIPRPNCFSYLQHAGQLRRDFFNYFHLEEGSNRDLMELFNFYASCGFAFANRSAAEIEASRQTSISEFDSTVVAPKLPLNYEEETDSALYRLGGGCLGEIWKVSKRLKENRNLTLVEKKKWKALYKLTFGFRMTQEEKKTHLTIELLNRDEGGMFFPKNEFLLFLRTVNDAVRKSANPEALQKYGKRMIKVVVAEVTNTSVIRELFFQSARTVISSSGIIVEDKQLEMFFNIWVRKIMHARVQEFVGHHARQVTEKGGHTLRDTLYSCVKGKKFQKKVIKRHRAPIKNDSLNKSRKPLNLNSGPISKKKVPKYVSVKKIKENIDEFQVQLQAGVRTPTNAVEPLKRSARNRKKLIFDDFHYN